jgi:high-affinity iron transporter
MLSAALIVFREILEAALLIGIIAAATRGVAKRGAWLAGGVVLGLIGAGIVAGFASVIANFASGMGQELFNAAVLGAAVIMLAWHNIWMASHGREMAQQAKTVGANIQTGSQSMSVLLVVVGLAVLREGSEVVLFLYGIAFSGGVSAGGMLAGGLLGAVLGAGLGFVIYYGLLKVPLRWFFSVTSGLILLLAAGMASQSARFLIQADMLPSLANPVWDSSAILPQGSAIGTLLHTLIGYDDQPSGMQFLVYVLTLILIVAGMKWVSRIVAQNRHKTAVI